MWHIPVLHIYKQGRRWERGNNVFLEKNKLFVKFQKKLVFLEKAIKDKQKRRIAKTGSKFKKVNKYRTFNTLYFKNKDVLRS